MSVNSARHSFTLFKHLTFAIILVLACSCSDGIWVSGKSPKVSKSTMTELPLAELDELKSALVESGHAISLAELNQLKNDGALSDEEFSQLALLIPDNK